MGTEGNDTNINLILILCTVLPVLGLIAVIAAVFFCWKHRRSQLSLFSRGISPIDDEEIATWKRPWSEKAFRDDRDIFTGAQRSKLRKPPSVRSKTAPSVVTFYSSYGRDRRSMDTTYRDDLSTYERRSIERTVPATPIHVRAPNAVAGLTDDSVPGEDPFVTSPRRYASRLSKPPPAHTSPRRGHTRARSSRSSMRSSRDFYSGASEIEVSPRTSRDYMRPYHGRSRVYSTSEMPPRLSFTEDGILGGLSPRPLYRDRSNEIGRAIG